MMMACKLQHFMRLALSCRRTSPSLLDFNCGVSSFSGKMFSLDQGYTKQNDKLNINELADSIQRKMHVLPGPARVEGIANVLQTFHDLATHKTSESVIADDMEQDMETLSEHSNISNDCEVISLTGDMCRNQLQRFYTQIERCLITHVQLTDGLVESTNTANVVNLLHGNLGFGTKVIVRLLITNPEIFELKAAVLESRIDHLRSCGLKQGFLQRSVSHTPQYLTIPETRIKEVTAFLTRDLDFTVKELPELFLYTPQVFLDAFKHTEDKFQYIYFTMGYKKHYVIARHGVMRYSHQHLRQRHLFLERRGQFQLTDKNRKTTVENPKLKLIVCSSDKNFCNDVALCKLDELHLFKEVLAVEDKLRKEESGGKEDDPKCMEFADKLLDEMKK